MNEQKRQEEVVALRRNSRAMLLNVLWHHQGTSSVVGRTIRELLGLGKQTPLTAEQVREAKRMDALIFACGREAIDGASARRPGQRRG